MLAHSSTHHRAMIQACECIYFMPMPPHPRAVPVLLKGWAALSTAAAVLVKLATSHPYANYELLVACSTSIFIKEPAVDFLLGYYSHVSFLTAKKVTYLSVRSNFV